MRDNLLPAQRHKIREARATYQDLKADPSATPEQRLEAAATYRQAVTHHRTLSAAIRQIEAAPDPAKLPAQMELRSGDHLGPQGAPPLAPVESNLLNYAPTILPTEEEIKALPKLIKKSSSEANQLVADKKDWEASGHSRKQAQAIISKYYHPEAFADIPANAILVPMPSTSGKNILPELLAQRIAQDRGAMDFQPRVAAATARKEAKHKTSFWQKIEDPVAYQSLDTMDQLKALASKARPIYIVEDIHTTGESWMAMRQLLKEEGIEPAGVAVLAANDTRMTTAADIERAAQKYAAASGSSLDEARAIVHPFLYGRFRKIAQKLEQSLGGKDALQAAKRLAALARLHARAGAAERGSSSRISGEVSQAGNLGDLS